MKLLRLLPLLFVSCVHALTTGDVEVRVYNGSSFTPTYLSWSNGQVITKTGGSPALVTLNAAAVGLGSVENTAVSTWAGSTNLTTLGTISTGSWNATPIPLAKGGTGSTTAADARVALGLTNATAGLNLSGLSIDGNVVVINSGGITAPAFDGDGSLLTGLNAASITAGVVAVANGGTGSTSASDARAALGLAIGTNVQGYNANLAAIAGGTWTGAASIATVGTVTSGTWNGTAVGLGYIAQGGATSGQLLRWNGSAWAPATVSAGDASGPASSTDNAVARFDGTGGKTLQNSTATIDDSGNLKVSGTASYNTPMLVLGSNGTGFASAGDNRIDMTFNGVGAVGFTQNAWASFYGMVGVCASRVNFDVWNPASGLVIESGTASPEGAVTANPGSLYLRNNSGTGEIWRKESGTGNTGWVKDH